MKPSSWSPSRLSIVRGKRIVVTGSTNGIGFATARALATAGAHVVLAVRNTKLGAARAAEIGGTTEVAQVDLADLSSVRRFVDTLDGEVDILINNAGMVPQRRTSTVDGFETAIGTNFLGPFALTNLLLPRVRERVVLVGSNAHRHATIDPDDIHLRQVKWRLSGAYAQSKLAVMLWGLELDRRLRVGGSPVTAMLSDPGWAASNISNKPKLGVVHKVVQAAANTFANDIDAGAAPTLYCLTEPIPPGSFVSVDGLRALRGVPVLYGRSALACDYELAARLWAAAEKETGTSYPL
ncbi:SDR family NAD(P)-dependent oxidoreductase [Williamsia limnetica]|uniref:SDR family NAD(P)-dependent oxidoreductase n=1 Tax=Williamsia limnetica TaxID=882452 RepID=UPI000D7C53FD|nr:SDR family NAD(P)-dependent oxidoreductase [Williamsia limnetica]